MLSFTRAGAVATPTTVQVRVTRRFPGRVSAGAPVPQRSLTPDELRANLQYFAVELAGPRTRACTALVLAGLELGAWPSLADDIATARSMGLERVTVHASPDDLEGLAVLGVDAAAVTVRGAGEARSLRAPGSIQLTAVVPLTAEVCAEAADMGEALAGSGAERVVLTWPFPDGVSAAPPPARTAAEAVARILPPLDGTGISAGVKGLPACALGSAERLWRSQNRWYVDAEHQRDQALLFFPDVVRFAKDDACRHCAAEAVCDGAPEQWLRAGLAGPLEPLER